MAGGDDCAARGKHRAHAAPQNSQFRELRERENASCCQAFWTEVTGKRGFLKLAGAKPVPPPYIQALAARAARHSSGGAKGQQAGVGPADPTSWGERCQN